MILGDFFETCRVIINSINNLGITIITFDYRHMLCLPSFKNSYVLIVGTVSVSASLYSSYYFVVN